MSLSHNHYIIVSVVIFILFSCSENSENLFSEIDIQATEDASVKLALEKELSKIPTSTPKPTSTPLPTATVSPTSTPKPISTSTPKPISTSTPKPISTSTPKPISTSTPKPTSTPILTATVVPPTSTLKPFVTKSPKPTPTPIPTPIPDLITDIKISATDLLSEFGTTSTPEIDFYKRSQANAKYLNKVLEVTGKITMTGYNDILNNPKMDVGIGDSQIYFKQVFCELSGNIIENINELELQQELQQEITLQGIYKEDTFFYIKLISCKRIKD